MILIPLPRYGFDPTEASIPWKYLSERGVKIVFATPDGKPAATDERLITGKGFGPFKKFLMAAPEAIAAYREMVRSSAFQQPIQYTAIATEKYTAILLPGGHDKGMKTYLESSVLQGKVAEFFAYQKLVGAICHGTVLAARATDQQTKRSVLYEYQTTGLLKNQEMGAYYLTALWLKDYYRTYPVTVEAEVKSALRSSTQFHTGKFSLGRDSETDESPALVVEDRNYLSARWPGDAHTFAKRFFQQLQKMK